MQRIRNLRKREAPGEPPNIALPFARHFPQDDAMDNETGPRNETGQQPRDFWSWATTPPQSYAVYLVCLILVFVLSFYAGTMKPKKAEGFGPPPSLAPPR
jgi:hypothetical protein